MTKRVILILLSILMLHSCKPQKPWSPGDEGTGEPAISPDAAVNSVVPISIDIGDAEQGVYLEATLAPDSIAPNVKEDQVKSLRHRLSIDNVTIAPPVPEKLWATYLVKATRNFAEKPVVLRARVMVEGKAVGSMSVVLGKDAQRSNFSVKVDLLSQFTQVPETFLATVEGDLLLMPEGTDEQAVNPETAQSPVSSNAILYNPIRVEIKEGASFEEAPGVAASAPGTEPASGSAGASPPEGTSAASGEATGSEAQVSAESEIPPAPPAEPTSPETPAAAQPGAAPAQP